jgi:hypothetical protein
MGPLKQFEPCRQSPWLDYLKHTPIESGGLRTFIERDRLKGVTSNPSIFEKVFAQIDEYSNVLQFQVPQLRDFSGFVEGSGEGRWTIETAIEEAVPADVLTTAIYARFRSRQEHRFGEKMLSAMRIGFGGHIGGIGPEPKSGGSRGRSIAQKVAE